MVRFIANLNPEAPQPGGIIMSIQSIPTTPVAFSPAPKVEELVMVQNPYCLGQYEWVPASKAEAVRASFTR